MIVSIVLAVAAALLNIIAAIGAPSQAEADGFGDVNISLARIVYALAGLLFVVAAILRVQQHDLAKWVIVAAAVAAIAGPLIYGALTGQFTLSHHLVRFVVVSVIVVVFWKL